MLLLLLSADECCCCQVYDFNPDMVQLSFLNVLKLVAPVHTSTMLQGPMFFLVVMKVPSSRAPCLALQ